MAHPDVTLPDLHGHTTIVTGANSGIGRAVADRLAAAGARVVLAVRDLDQGKAAAAAMTGDTEVRLLDLGDLASVLAFAGDWTEPIDLLFANAGIAGAIPFGRTADGFEQMIGVNHLGHFALTLALLERLRGRVIVTSSMAERSARLDLDDLNWARREYRPRQAYADSKLANLLFTGELQRRLTAAGSPVAVHAAHPGLVATAIYHRHPARSVFGRVVTALLLRLVAQAPEQGALPLLHAAVADLEPDSFTGPAHLVHMRGAPVPLARSDPARDVDLARRLWAQSETLTGVRSPV